MTDKIFVDTNVLVYAYDISANKKHEVAVSVIENLWYSGNGILSSQVLSEFFVVVTRKIPNPLSVEIAKSIIKDFLTWDVIPIYEDSVLDAIDILQKYNLSFWDSMIVECALRGGASLLLSEDFSDGLEIEKLRIQNPFK
ncbi:PIN domain-containing protein [Thermodesulfovibrio yellowstonii]|uniref:Twitching motility protein PilT n=1 Tax=Thermodesulfovibrio yellowstonii TaxID=28262 RepID=A0A9W6GGR1_9BACT|nr:PIN domain-containing protein [Thermodesulfovibrio islandicus]GLI53845.1 twitching motility protein PilT [Thermodesulfovibrio islandicus]